MKVRNWMLLVALALFVLFVLLNLDAVLAPTSLNFLVAQIHAPLGLVLLALTGLLLLVFGGYLLFWQTHVLLEARSHAKELQSQRKLADEAEASRFTELRAFLQEHFKAQDDAQAALLARVTALEQALQRQN